MEQPHSAREGAATRTVLDGVRRLCSLSLAFSFSLSLSSFCLKKQPHPTREGVATVLDGVGIRHVYSNNPSSVYMPYQHNCTAPHRTTPHQKKQKKHTGQKLHQVATTRTTITTTLATHGPRYHPPPVALHIAYRTLRYIAIVSQISHYLPAPYRMAIVSPAICSTTYPGITEPPLIQQLLVPIRTRGRGAIVPHLGRGDDRVLQEKHPYSRQERPQGDLDVAGLLPPIRLQITTSGDSKRELNDTEQTRAESTRTIKNKK